MPEYFLAIRIQRIVFPHLCYFYCQPATYLRRQMGGTHRASASFSHHAAPILPYQDSIPSSKNWRTTPPATTISAHYHGAGIVQSTLTAFRILLFPPPSRRAVCSTQHTSCNSAPSMHILVCVIARENCPTGTPSASVDGSQLFISAMCVGGICFPIIAWRLLPHLWSLVAKLLSNVSQPIVCTVPRSNKQASLKVLPPTCWYCLLFPCHPSVCIPKSPPLAGHITLPWHMKI